MHISFLTKRTNFLSLIRVPKNSLSTLGMTDFVPKASQLYTSMTM